MSVFRKLMGFPEKEVLIDTNIYKPTLKEDTTSTNDNFSSDKIERHDHDVKPIETITSHDYDYKNKKNKENKKKKSWFSKKKIEKTVMQKLYTEPLSNSDRIYELADLLLQGYPLIVNLEQCNVNDANSMLAFLSGVIYSLDGDIEAIHSDEYLFALKEDRSDPELREYINNLKL